MARGPPNRDTVIGRKNKCQTLLFNGGLKLSAKPNRFVTDYTARSSIRLGWAGNTWAGVKIWISAQETWSRLRRQLTEDQFVEIRFEEIVEDHEGVLKRICAFLGTEYDPVMLEIERDTTYKRLMG